MSCFHVQLNRTVVTIVTFNCYMYTSVCYILCYMGLKELVALQKSCVYLFFGLLAFFVLFGGEAKHIIETGVSLRLGGCFKISLNLRTLIHLQERHLSIELTISTGHTGWYGAGGSVLYRKYFQRTYRSSKIPRRIVFGVGSTIVSFIVPFGNYSLDFRCLEKQISLQLMKNVEICMK